jgi:STE24 endopeptidase
MEDSRKYEHRKHAVTAAAFAIDASVLAYFLVSGFTLRLRDFVQSISSSPWISVFFYILIFGGILKILHLPLDLYSGYVLEHKFGLSRQTLPGWLKDQMIALTVGAVFAIGAVELIYYALRVSPDWWWLYSSLGFIAVAVVLSNLAPVLLLPLFYKFVPLENAEVARRVERLARRTDTKVCGVYEWSLGDKTRKANAAVVGWGNTRRIIVSDTLLRHFTPEEIEVIMAHELCHHAKNHIWQGIGVQAALTLAGFYITHVVLTRFSAPLGFSSIADVANFPFLIAVSTAISIAVLPVVNGFSRRLEQAADLYALDVTGDSLAFVSSLEKLAALNLASTSPHWLTEFIFHSHPSIEKRIRLAADRVGQIA